jgi:preprotein translocase subunit SecE
MADTDTKEKDTDAKDDALASADATDASALAKVEAPSRDDHDDHDEAHDHEEGVAPAQIGERRFVYGAYFAGAITVAFVVSKALHNVWVKLGLWKPLVGEPRDDVLFVLSAIIGILTALYYWRRTRARQLAEEVAQELSKVTWPSKQEVTSSTAVVIVTTAVATVFFALMDRFWGFVTNFVYGI